MRKALIIGIDFYSHFSHLHGCINDAYDVKAVLERNGDGTTNFNVKQMMGASAENAVTRVAMRNAIKELFSGESEIALLYFAGHGSHDSVGGYICPTDGQLGDEGVPLAEIMALANKSKARNKVIILDSCHSGAAGNSNQNENISELSEGITVLTASTANQYANEENGHGVFTGLLVDALNGAAANLVGEITPGSVYAHIDQSLGAWEPRPVFKTNVQNFVSLRKVHPPIELKHLHRIADLFPSSSFEYPLNPSYEPERATSEAVETDARLPKPNPQNTEIFSVLQKLNRINLVVPVDAPHMYHAAMNSKGCKLSVLGEHYRSLVLRKQI